MITVRPVPKFSDVKIIELQAHQDTRGELIEIQKRELVEVGIKENYPLGISAISFRNVFRGMHYQVGRFAQAKLVRCVQGSIDDLFIDLREGSPTYLEEGMVSIEDPYTMLYLPIGFAHGYVTNAPTNHVLYMASSYQDVMSERSIFQIKFGNCVRSERDQLAKKLEEYAKKPDFRWEDGVTTCL